LGRGSSALAKLNDLDPQAWLADVLARIADTQRDCELLPWKWKKALTPCLTRRPRSPRCSPNG
jgi:IS66 C-terminal element